MRSLVAVLAALVAAPLAMTLLASPSQADPFGPRPELVRDIVPGTGGSFPERGVALGDRLLFVASTPGTGLELWVTDLTDGGTRLVKDIEAGPEGALEHPILETPVVLGKRIFFAATTAGQGRELWTSDGTAAGTRLVKDIWPGAESAFASDLVVAGGRLYFAAGDPVHGAELWVSDGSSAGTHVVTDIAPGSASSNPGYLTTWGDRVVLQASDGVTGGKPWISDGTEAGTYRLGGTDPNVGSASSRFTIAGDRVVFSAATGSDYELWASDGTPGSAVLVKDLRPGAGSSSPNELTRLGGLVVFVAYDAALQTHVWVSDGTNAGTREIDPLPAGRPALLTAFGGAVYFRAEDAAHGQELWRTRGTEESTVLVRDLEPGPDGSSPQGLATVAGRLLVTADTTGRGEEPWVSDGTPAGTRLVADLLPGRVGSQAFPIGFVGASVVYVAGAAGAGYEPWGWTLRPSTTRALHKPRYPSAQARRRQITILVRVTSPEVSITGGRVVLREASRVIGSAAVVRGRATVRINERLEVGRHRLRASYVGSVQARASVSPRFRITITRGDQR